MTEKLRTWWWQIKQHPFIVIGVIVILFALIVFIFAVHTLGWDWTGFIGGESKVTITNTPQGTTTAIERLPARTLWDWLVLLAIPVVAGVLGAWFTGQLGKASDKRDTLLRRQEAEMNMMRERESLQMIENQFRTSEMQAYLDKISELLLDRNLRRSMPEDEVRDIARARTLTVLTRLDATRKKSILQFLYESGLINKSGPIVELSGADLWQADLKWIDLKDADLRGVLC